MMNKTLTTVLITLLLSGLLSARDGTRQALLMAMEANGKQAVSYQWKQKVTVVRKGNPLEPVIEELRFDATGQLQRVTLVKPEEKRMGPLRARKAADVKETVQDVMQLARQYASPHQISQAIQSGEVWEGQARLRIQARALVLPLDEMVVTVNTGTYLATRVECKTQYEGSPVVIGIDYENLPNGPSLMTRMTVQIPKEDIVIHFQSFDFVRLASPANL